MPPLLRIEPAANSWLLFACIAGGVLCIILFLLCRHYLRQTRVALVERDQALAAATAAKAKLFSIVSHDLRTPVSQLFSLLDLEDLPRRGQTAPGIHALPSSRVVRMHGAVAVGQQVRESAGRILDAIDDILLWSRSQLDIFEPVAREISVDDAVEEVLQVYAPLLLDRDVLLRRQVPSALTLDADQTLFKTVLRILIGNAIRFSPRGGEVSITAGFDDRGTHIEISDQGPGMGVAQLRAVLEWSTVRSESSGYGLALSQELVHRLNGEMDVRSSPGAGTRVILRFT